MGRGRVVVLLALLVLEAGWFAFDGAHALLTGDYVTPSSGSHAGQLGPWAGLVRSAGIDPRSTGMKTFFLAYGVVWLATAGTLARRLPRGRAALVAFAAGAAWYLPFGTLLSGLQLGILASMGRARG